jgi:hypothetical protein
MLVEGTIRWQVVEDAPWDLLVLLCLRDMTGIAGMLTDPLPPVDPLPRREPERDPGSASELALQWQATWDRHVAQLRPSTARDFTPPHFPAFDRALEMQDALWRGFEAADRWALDRMREHAVAERRRGAKAPVLAQLVLDREQEIHRRTTSFRLDLLVLPVAGRGGWVVGPGTVAVSAALRSDDEAFRRWMVPVIASLV